MNAPSSQPVVSAVSDRDPAATAREAAGRWPAWIVQLRPAHWIKNVFVLAPALFAGRLLDPGVAASTGLTALAFCALASAVYVLNDLHDRDQDRLHPVRARRPLAAGTLSVGLAVALGLVLSVGGLGLAALAGSWAAARGVESTGPGWLGGLALAYLLVNALYTYVLRAVAGLDVLALASLFVLRLLAGAGAVPAEPSVWLLVCGGLLALELALGKRRVEQLGLGHRAALARPSLRAWSAAGLRRTVAAVGLLTFAAYVVYTIAPRTVGHVGSRALLVTVPLVAFGLWRHQRLVESAVHRDPVELVVHDRPLLVCGLAWVVLALVIVQG